MLGSTDHDRVNRRKLVHQFPKISVASRQGMTFCGSVDMRLIDITQCRDMDGAAIVKFIEIGTAPATDTHEGNVDLVVLRPAPFTCSQRTCGNGGTTHRLQKPPPRFAGIKHHCSSGSHSAQSIKNGRSDIRPAVMDDSIIPSVTRRSQPRHLEPSQEHSKTQGQRYSR